MIDRRCVVRLTSQPLYAPRKSPQHLLNRRLRVSRTTRTFWKRQKYLATAGIVIPDFLAHSLDNISTMLSTYVTTLNDTHNSIFKFSKRPSKVRIALFWAITQHSLCRSPEERNSHLLGGGSLKSRYSQLSDFKFEFLCYDIADNRPLGQSDNGNCCFLSFI